jgi:hypothetical protein
MRRSKMKIFDNGGKTVDRYTVVFTDVKETKDCFYALGMSENPYHPQGFGQHCSAQVGDHLGKEIEFFELPYDCKKMVMAEFERTTLDKILCWESSKYGAPMGRMNVGSFPVNGYYVKAGKMSKVNPKYIQVPVFDCNVPINSGGYDKGGAYWGFGSELRVSYTKDLSYIEFYRR